MVAWWDEDSSSNTKLGVFSSYQELYPYFLLRSATVTMVALSTFMGKGIVPFKLRRRMRNAFVTTSARTQQYHAQIPPNTSFVKRTGEKQKQNTVFCVAQ